MNEYDSDRIAQALYSDGWMKTDNQEDADLLILNTCTVRQLAEEKAYSLIGRWNKLKKTNPKLIIGMAGCLAQYTGEKAFKRSPGLNFLVGPRSLTSIPDIARRARHEKKIALFDIQEFGEGAGAIKEKKILSAFVAAMDGCDQFCSYCAVPRSRGREASRLPEAILKEVERQILQGAKEITLLGQNISRYGFDFENGPDLADLLEQVAGIEGVRRLRFITGHPKAFSDKLIHTMANVGAVCESLHLPLQAGSDRILEAMRRGYTKKDYLELVAKLRQAIPNISLSTDIIVGFPGETEADFSETLEMVDAIGFDMAYCFKFSPREGTVAAKLDEQIDQSVKEERLSRLLDLVEQGVGKRKKAFLHKEVCVLVEGWEPKKEGRLQGRTSTNHIVYFDGIQEDIGQEKTIRITEAANWSLIGEKID